MSSITPPRANLRQPVFASLSRCYAQNRVFNYEPSMLSMLLHASPAEPGLRLARPHSDRFDRLEVGLLSTKLDAQTHQIAELQIEVALLRTAVQSHTGASAAPIAQQAAAQLAPPLRSSKSSKASSSDAFLSTALQAGRTYKRGAPTADERSAVRGMHRRFSWDALNVTNANTQCGWHKCYFPSQREGEGWLVGMPPCLRIKCRNAAGRLGPKDQIPEMAPPTRWFPQYSRAWALAEELRVGFGVDHLLREPPFLAALPHEQATYMNAKIKALEPKIHPRWRHWRIANATTYYAAGLHPVQGVRSCSYPECMLLRCGGFMVMPLTAQAIEGFVANAPNKTKLSQGIQQSFALVPAMVKAHPCLKIDFQVYLRNDGAVLNIDLDRCDELNPGTREPVNASQKLALAQIPGLCQKASGQVFLNRALGQLYERLRQ